MQIADRIRKATSDDFDMNLIPLYSAMFWAQFQLSYAQFPLIQDDNMPLNMLVLIAMVVTP